jgi:lipopolysaccharide export LptBFGC system permease protein LptF
VRTLRFIATTVIGWLLLVIMGAAIFVWLATTIERLGQVDSGAAWIGLLQLPGILVRLLPLCILLGVALAVARMDFKGERIALWMLGHGAVRTGAVVGLLGLLLGLGGLGLQSGPIAQLERHSLAEGGVSVEGWVWAEGRALRAQDGRVVEPHGSSARIGSLTRLEQGGLPQAWISLHPSSSSNAELMASSHRPQRLELHARVSRVVACGLLAFWAWTPLRGGRRRGGGTVVALGLGWSLLELIAQGLVLAGSLPVALGAWTPSGALAAICAIRVLRTRGWPQSRTQT